MPEIWHPFTQHGLGAPMLQIVRGEGAKLYTNDGREIIDAISSWWVNTHGHCHPKIMAAIKEQAERLDQMIFAGWTHDVAQGLADDLQDFLPDALSHIFFSDSGSTSVEVALKMALGYWHNIGEPRHRIIVLEHSYHGDTFGGMSVGERGTFNRAYSPLLFDVVTVPFPVQGHEQDSVDALEALLGDMQTPPAAFIVEPLISGAGGMKIYSPETLARFHAACKRHGVPFIADEVMTGWGRTGSMFACDQAGIVPDIMCLSKGLTGGSIPLAITACTRLFFDAHYSADRADMFYHSSSYTANPLACAAARANLGVWHDEPVLDRIAHIAARHRIFADELAGYSNCANIRQLGTILAFEIVPASRDSGQGYLSRIGPDLLEFFSERDILLRPLGNVLYIMPPYCIENDALDKIYEVIRDALDVFG